MNYKDRNNRYIYMYYEHIHIILYIYISWHEYTKDIYISSATDINHSIYIAICTIYHNNSIRYVYI